MGERAPGKGHEVALARSDHLRRAITLMQRTIGQHGHMRVPLCKGRKTWPFVKGGLPCLELRGVEIVYGKLAEQPKDRRRLGLPIAPFVREVVDLAL